MKCNILTPPPPQWGRIHDLGVKIFKFMKTALRLSIYAISFFLESIEVKIFKYYIYINTIWQFWSHIPCRIKNPYPGEHKFYNFGRRLSSLSKYAVRFYLVSAEVNKKIFKHYLFIITIWPFWPHPRIEIPTTGDMKYTILVEGFLGYVTMN